MEAQKNPNGTGGSPKVEVIAKKTPLGNWLFICLVNGLFYSSSSCRKKGDAKAHIKQDLSAKGYAYPEA